MVFLRYACLVAEAADATNRMSQEPFVNIVGALDCTIQD
uniref:Uncharacterized protein n=1 Tax=Arundo donax TaxID=35708 RepID=A0A0A9E9S6_ARUDO